MSEETVTVSFKVSSPGVSFEAQVDVPAGQTNLTRILPALQDLDNLLIGGVVGQMAAEGVRVSCGPGCGACCCQLVTLSLFEAEALGDWMAELPAERRAAIEARFDAAVRRLAQAGILQRLADEPWDAGSDSGFQMALDYFLQGVACPFLEEESCSIHPLRPLICREFLVSSPPAWCSNRDPEHKPEPVRMPLHLSRVLVRMGAELQEGGRGWIPLVFLTAWLRHGLRPGELVAGEGPRVLYEFVSRLNEAQPPA